MSMPSSLELAVAFVVPVGVLTFDTSDPDEDGLFAKVRGEDIMVEVGLERPLDEARYSFS